MLDTCANKIADHLDPLLREISNLLRHSAKPQGFGTGQERLNIEEAGTRSKWNLRMSDVTNSNPIFCATNQDLVKLFIVFSR